MSSTSICTSPGILLRVAKAFFLLSYLLPVFAALSVYELYDNELGLWYTSFGEVIAAYIALFVIWLPLSFVIAGFLLPSQQQNQKHTSRRLKTPRSLLALLFILVGIIIVLASLAKLRFMLEEKLFYLIMVTLFFGGLAVPLSKKGNLLTATLLITLYTWGVGYISFVVYLGSWLWQPLLFSLALAFAFAPGWVNFAVGHLLSEGEQTLPLKPPPLNSIKEPADTSRIAKTLHTLRRLLLLTSLRNRDYRLAVARRSLVLLIPLSVVLCPFSVASLVYLHELPSRYLLVFVLIPLLFFPLKTVEKTLNSGELTREFSAQLLFLPALFIATLIVVRLL